MNRWAIAERPFGTERREACVAGASFSGSAKQVPLSAPFRMTSLKGRRAQKTSARQLRAAGRCGKVMEKEISISEIFKSIQGETSYAGLPCNFVRFAGCNLHCTYCDTRYAAEQKGEPFPPQRVIQEVESLGSKLTCITGGEPLLQQGVEGLAAQLLQLGHKLLVETNGTQDVSRLPEGVIRVMDVKCPGSGECGKTLESNLRLLGQRDELKFVISDREDFDWSVRYVQERGLQGRCHLLFAPAWGRLAAAELASWILESGLQVRLQVQLHRILWPEKSRGV